MFEKQLNPVRPEAPIRKANWAEYDRLVDLTKRGGHA
jgi:hypothetical protein